MKLGKILKVGATALLGTTVVVATLATLIDKYMPRNDLSGVAPEVQAFLDNPDEHMGDIPVGNRVIALSQIAQGCTSLAIGKPGYQTAAEQCVTKTAEIAQQPNVASYWGSPKSLRNLSQHHGLYLAHLNIILGAYERTVGDGEHDTLNTRVSEHLAQTTTQDQTHHMISFKGEHFRYPADQSAALFSLWVYDQNNGTNLSDEPIAAWLSYMEHYATDVDTELHIAEVTGGQPWSETPRGCALSMTTGYMAQFAPEEAEELWDAYKDDRYGLFGFREWPLGSQRSGDIDSGPILFGYGVAATAFGIEASNNMDNHTVYAHLRAQEWAVETAVDLVASQRAQNAAKKNGLESVVAPVVEVKKLKDSPLAKGMQFNAHHAAEWY